MPPPWPPPASTSFPRPLSKNGGDGKRGGADVEVQLISRGVKRRGEVRLVGGSKGAEERQGVRERESQSGIGERQRRETALESERTGVVWRSQGVSQGLRWQIRRICPYLFRALNSRDASQRRAAGRGDSLESVNIPMRGDSGFN